MNQQMAIQAAQEMMRNGMTAMDANIEVIRMQGVRVVGGKIGRDMRSGLMAAVASGRLGHLKKLGLMPEVFFHPNSNYKALEARHRIANESIAAIKKCCA